MFTNIFKKPIYAKFSLNLLVLIGLFLSVNSSCNSEKDRTDSFDDTSSFEEKPTRIDQDSLHELHELQDSLNELNDK